MENKEKTIVERLQLLVELLLNISVEWNKNGGYTTADPDKDRDDGVRFWNIALFLDKPGPLNALMGGDLNLARIRQLLAMTKMVDNIFIIFSYQHRSYHVIKDGILFKAKLLRKGTYLVIDEEWVHKTLHNGFFGLRPVNSRLDIDGKTYELIPERDTMFMSKQEIADKSDEEKAISGLSALFD